MFLPRSVVKFKPFITDLWLEHIDNNSTDQSGIELSTAAGITDISTFLPIFRGPKLIGQITASVCTGHNNCQMMCDWILCRHEWIGSYWFAKFFRQHENDSDEANATCLEVGPTRFGPTPEKVLHRCGSVKVWMEMQIITVWLGAAKSAGGKTAYWTKYWS